jgi:hypothetical protein
VHLIDGEGGIVESSTIDDEGNYGFGGATLRAGVAYRVRVPVQQAALAGLHPPPALIDPATADIVLALPLPSSCSQQSVEAPLLALEPATGVRIGDKLFSDDNHNGRQDPDDTPLGGVVVQLLNADGTELARTTSDAAGSYEFTEDDGLQPNTQYSLAIDLDQSILTTKVCCARQSELCRSMYRI